MDMYTLKSIPIIISVDTHYQILWQSALWGIDDRISLRSRCDFDFHGVGVDVALFDGNVHVVRVTGPAFILFFELDD